MQRHLVQSRLVQLPTVVLALASSVLASDWSNLGGNTGRNGLTTVLGPTSSASLWNNNADPAVIAWQPVIHGNRVFTIRESGFPQNGGAANDALVCYDLDTGVERWRTTVPFNGDTSQQWIAWIAGAHGGKVYVCRAENGKPNPILEYDAATGAPGWTSAATTQAFAYDGVVFAPDGDLLVGDLAKVVRIDAQSGGTVWTHVRARSVSGNCGVVCTATAVFTDEVVVGGQVLSKLDMATGLELYESPLMSGFTEQNAPFLSPDGQTVYFARSQNNPGVDFLYSFQDTGTALVENWHRPVRWTTSHEHGIASDGSIYTFLATDEFVRLDPATGNVVNTAGVLSPLGSPNLSPKTAVDAAGNVYVSNGWASTPAGSGRVWAFNADLSVNYFTLNLSRPNQGGPALGQGGALVVCDLAGVHAYGTPAASVYCTAKVNSLGCTPWIDYEGEPSVSFASPFAIAAFNVINNKNGLFLYGTNGPLGAPFQGGYLCVASPIQRTAVQSSAGNAPPDDCSGSYVFDFNAWIQTGSDPDLVPGAQVNGQFWSRDPASASTTGLSDAIEFVVQP